MGTLGRPPRPAHERFYEKVAPNEVTECLEWQAGLFQKDGYGQFQYRGRPHGAHRWAYEYMVGPVPDGLELDHLCANPTCVNTEHMEPVTKAVNLKRMHQRRRKAA